MKTAGIIGGLGPETTTKFYLEIISSCAKKNNEARPPILIWNLPIPFKTEEDLIIRCKGQEKYLPFLIDAARGLEKAGADFLVMPCDTMHIFIKEIRNTVTIPIISIIDETLEEIKRGKIAKVGLLGTSTTINNNLFEKIQPMVPNKKEQNLISKIIMHILTNNLSKRDKLIFHKITKQMTDDGAEAIILACTDLHQVSNQTKGVRFIDTLEVLKDATVKEIL